MPLPPVQDTIDAYLKEYERVTGQKARIWEKVRYVLSRDSSDHLVDVEFTQKELCQALTRLKEQPTHKSLQNPVETPPLPK